MTSLRYILEKSIFRNGGISVTRNLIGMLFQKNHTLVEKTTIMENNNFKGKLTFQFMSEPTDVNYGGKVHGGIVMKWIDQAAFACAGSWSESYCVTVYVGGIRFYKPVKIGDLVKVDAQII
mgnify:CR=1 FL=1